MAADAFSTMMGDISTLHKVFHGVFDTGFLIFSRMLGFILIAPVFGRKDVPFNIKMGFCMMLTWVLVWIAPAHMAQRGWVNSDDLWWYLMQVFMNVTVGTFIGFIAACIMEVINAGGSLMNNQIGLSSAMMFDPSSRQQVALTEKLFGFIGLMVFFHIGGVYWLLDAFHRSFEVFPLYTVKMDFAAKVSLDYLVEITGNSLEIGTQLIAPVMVVTMSVDLILGIVNRVAQQIQVFQLSFALKPCIGIGAFLLTLPIFIKLLENYLSDYASYF